jgi:hypothetical protein
MVPPQPAQPPATDEGYWVKCGGQKSFPQRDLAGRLLDREGKIREPRFIPLRSRRCGRAVRNFVSSLHQL